MNIVMGGFLMLEWLPLTSVNLKFIFYVGIWCIPEFFCDRMSMCIAKVFSSDNAQIFELALANKEQAAHWDSFWVTLFSPELCVECLYLFFPYPFKFLLGSLVSYQNYTGRWIIYIKLSHSVNECLHSAMWIPFRMFSCFTLSVSRI